MAFRRDSGKIFREDIWKVADFGDSLEVFNFFLTIKDMGYECMGFLS